MSIQTSAATKMDPRSGTPIRSAGMAVRPRSLGRFVSGSRGSIMIGGGCSWRGRASGGREITAVREYTRQTKTQQTQQTQQVYFFRDTHPIAVIKYPRS